MNVTQWIIFILVVQVIHFLGTWKLYVKAGRKAWEAAIPVYNAIVLMQIIRRPKWWVILLFLPIINLLMFPVIWVETIRSFGRNKLWETWAVILTLGFYIYYVNYALDVKYVEDRSLQPQSGLGEWVSSIVFAVVAATLVHTYVMQPYVIPTGSLERTLRIGDLLFVSKFHYGARTPMTTVAAPMVHDTLPFLGTKSYLKKPQLPFFRFPGVKNVERNDIVVFSWPADTVRVFFRREKGVDKPIDKKSNYVKRCVGLPGDSLQVKDGYVFINGEQLVLSDRAKPMYSYKVHGNKGIPNNILQEVNADFRRTYLFQGLTENQIRAIQSQIRLFGSEQRPDGRLALETDKNGFPVELKNRLRLSIVEETGRHRTAWLTADMAKKLEQNSSVDSVTRTILPENLRDSNLFPQSPDYPWNYSQMGPIYIPKKDATISLNLKVLPMYKRIIEEYEHKTIKVVGNQIYLDGEPANSYTFEQNYYWMMGDNRDSSEDSRAWGYVPENHIVGTPVFIWMSFDNFVDSKGRMNAPWKWKPRWDRIFTTVNGDGEPVSYFKYFLIALALYFVGEYFWKKRKKA